MIANAIVLLVLGGPTAYLCAAVIAHELRERHRRAAPAEPASTARHIPAADQRAA
ncbi:hypothetical protein [Nocardia fluminea]|uniref:hypothetical protein n=1 Tax=Nocardia fluminea TaxID=134984 RepID=UPI0034182ED4